jgi:hypothetical protein
MSTRRKIHLAVGAAIGGVLFLCLACFGGTTALSAFGILPTPGPTTAATVRPTKPPGPTPTPRQFVHDPTPYPSTTDRFVFLVRSAYWTNRADLVPPAGQRYLLLSVEVRPNGRADKKWQGGAVYEPNFQLVAGDKELTPDKAARETIGARGFGDMLGTTITASKGQTRTLIFLVPADQEHFRLQYAHGGVRPIEFTLRLPAIPPPAEEPLPPESTD